MKFGPYSFEASNLDKELFPESGFTKSDLIEYYTEVADYLLPHAKDRPLAMHRFPDGIEGKDFFQKDVPDYFPDWIHTVEVEREEGSIHMLTADNKATLAYLGQQACIAAHVFLSCTPQLRQPDKMLFDLDPPQDRFDLVVEAAKALREHLERVYGLMAFVMTSGSAGLHVVVPLRPQADFERVRSFARRVSEEVVEQHPDDFTVEMRKDKREGRLLIDYLRNSYGQHSIVPYGVRALPGAPVATPLDWEEVSRLKNGAQTYNIGSVLRRLGQKGDPWKGIAKKRQALPEAG
ncbi:MAG TPA: non-homologous end-joining DNA ligase [Phaeodactylibacter sp.]|nr:non-homologous end-joining DNA ligase [Phaeodactylibacter sp.]